MTKFFNVVLILICSYTLHSQSFELIQGFTKNNFYDRQEMSSGNRSSYSSDISHFYGLGLHQIKAGKLDIGITIIYEKYRGTVMADSTGLNVGRSIEADVNKSILSFGFYPINTTLFGNVDLNLGVVASSLVREKFSGTDRTFDTGSSSGVPAADLQDKYAQFSSNSYLGIRGRLVIKYKVGKEFYLVPVYSFYYGLLDEFRDFPRSTKSMRHSFGLALFRTL